MDRRKQDRFRHVLARHREQLLDWWNQDAGKRSVYLGPTLKPDQKTPIDVTIVAGIDQALERIDHGDFGTCEVCGGSVEPERLELDFTTCVCLDHYTEDQLRALERDLELAARVQKLLFPCCLPALPGIQIAAHTRPAQIVSGDYYDFFCYRDNVQGVVLADVMGKGLPASMLMANLQATLRLLGPEHDALHTLAARLNELFRYNLKVIRFISMFLLAIDVEAGVLRYCNAGHHPPLLLKAGSRSIQWLKPTGPAIGLMPEPTYASETLSFEPGDLLLLYTDGLVEGTNREGQAFGEERLARYAEQHHHLSADAFLAGLHRTATRFSNGARHDDLTLVVVKATDDDLAEPTR